MLSIVPAETETQYRQIRELLAEYIASGQERSESDIDLMVIGSVSPADLALPLRRP